MSRASLLAGSLSNHAAAVGLSVSLLALAIPSFAAPRDPAREVATPPWMDEDDPASRGGFSGSPLAVYSDTLRFGYIGAGGFAIEGETWTWDHGGPDPLEGWIGVDAGVQTDTWFRHIDATIWETGDNPVEVPVLAGAGSAWVGAFENEADSLCWEGGLGYGDDWCQRLVSPVLTYSGSGIIDLAFTYFSESEEDWDYTRILLRRGDGTELSLNGDGFSGLHGTNLPLPPTGTVFATQIDAGDLDGSLDFSLVFEFASGSGWSDEDGRFDSTYGPFGFDSMSLTGALTGGDVTYGFESDLEGWSPQICPSMGTLVGVAAASGYDILDLCDCGLSGNVLEVHDDNQEHPYGQHEFLTSNPVDVLNDVTPNLGSQGLPTILAEWDHYVDLPRANGVFYRPGWDYYPYECLLTGAIGWSGRVGQNNFLYVPDATCDFARNVATANGVPGDVEQIRFLYEIYASCDAFGIPPQECTDITNFSPLLDNVRIGFTRSPNAPVVTFSPGSNSRFRDTFSADGSLSPFATGNCDTEYNVNFGNTPPFIQGDSLFVRGPVSTPQTRWETRLWFRVARKGPAQDQIAAYPIWRDRMADGNDIENGEFTFAWMDSFQSSSGAASKNSFVSYLREDDDDYDVGAGEISSGNEILADGIFVPGTRIEYFVTANYIGNSDNYLKPDTSGGNFFEIRFLPEYHDDGGVWKFPSLLYIDAGLLGDKVERMLNVALHGASPGDPLPEYPLWDHYEYLGAACCWAAPFARGVDPRSTSGATARHLLGYRGILLTTGQKNSYAWPEDYELFSDWFGGLRCADDAASRGFILNGDRSAVGLEQSPSFAAFLGIQPFPWNENYRTITGDANYCVRIEDAAGSGYPPTAEYDAWGNGCPNEFSFGILTATGTGVGNRAFENVATSEVTPYQQVTNDVSDPFFGTYRSVVSSVSYDHLSLRESGDECTPTFDRIIEAGASELGAALGWIFDGSIPGLHEYDPCAETGVDDPVSNGVTGTTRLFAGQPNPFSPRTRIRYELAAKGSASLSVYDVAGRRVRVLVSETQDAGPHEVVWEGTDDAGVALPAGVYWTQLETAGYSTNKKLVVLK